MAHMAMFPFSPVKRASLLSVMTPQLAKLSAGWLASNMNYPTATSLFVKSWNGRHYTDLEARNGLADGIVKTLGPQGMGGCCTDMTVACTSAGWLGRSKASWWVRSAAIC